MLASARSTKAPDIRAIHLTKEHLTRQQALADESMATSEGGMNTFYMPQILELNSQRAVVMVIPSFIVKSLDHLRLLSIGCWASSNHRI